MSRQLDLLSRLSDRAAEAARTVAAPSSPAPPRAPLPRAPAPLRAHLSVGAATVRLVVEGPGAPRACRLAGAAMVDGLRTAIAPTCAAARGARRSRATFSTVGLSEQQVRAAVSRAAAVLTELGATVRATQRASARGAAEARARDPLTWLGPAPEKGTDLRPYVAEALTAWRVEPVRVVPRAPTLPVLPFTFWLGTHEASWLARTSVPLFVSRRRFYHRSREQLARTLPRALAPWALDSGGFTEVAKHQRWRISGRRYVEDVRRLMLEVGSLAWAAPQDWMVEPQVVAGTGLSVRLHQQLTVQNLVALRMIDPTLPIIPVLQGWSMDDYLRHVEDYDRAGIDLRREPLVGVGTMCRRDGCPTRIANMLRRLRSEGIAKMHAFGVKTQVLSAGRALQDRRQGTFESMLRETNGGADWLGGVVSSADSLAWSKAAYDHAAAHRDDPARAPMIPGHVHGITNACNNCLEWALVWRKRVLEAAGVRDDAAHFYRAAKGAEDRALPDGRWSLG